MTATNYHEINRKSLLGSFDLELDSGMVIYGMLLFDGANGKWCKFPEIPQYKDGAPLMKDGKQVYKRTMSIPDRAKSDKFTILVIAALQMAGHI